MSEHDRDVLDRLEQEFRSRPSSLALSRWWSVSATQRLAGAAVAAPVGLLLLVVGLALGNAGGMVLALVACALLSASAMVVLDRAMSARAAVIDRRHHGSPPPRYAR